MWDLETGHVAGDLYILGTIRNPVFLIGGGEEWTLVEGGLARTAPLVLRQLDEVLGDRRRLRHWLITHSHYDHCGMIGQLAPCFPGLRIHATAETARALASPRAQKVVSALNESIATLGLPQERVEPPSAPPPVPIEQLSIELLADGDTVELGGGRRVLVRATPGHSRCSTTFFDLHSGRAFVSDTLGEAVSEGVFCPLAFDDLAAYRRSIEQVRQLEARELILGHHGRLVRESASRAPLQALQALEDFANHAVEIAPRVGGDLMEVARQFSEHFHAPSASFVPEELHRKSMLRVLELLRAEGRLGATGESPSPGGAHGRA